MLHNSTTEKTFVNFIKVRYREKRIFWNGNILKLTRETNFLESFVLHIDNTLFKITKTEKKTAREDFLR
jgi:hypothetical protein